MKNIWRSFAKKILHALPFPVKNKIQEYRSRSIIKKWEQEGKPVPPPHQIKQLAIQNYKNRFGLNVLVETGTYLGDMIEAQKKKFDRIFSIELGEKLWRKAVNRFKNEKHITLIHGDSGEVLKSISEKLNEPALFWLDGHYSGGITAKGNLECPILKELDAIFLYSKFNHVLLIDDARCFDGTNDYPTIEELTNYIKNKNEKYIMEIKDDIIYCTIE